MNVTQTMMQRIQSFYLGKDFFQKAQQTPLTYDEIQAHFHAEVQDKRNLLFSFPTRRFVDYLFTPVEGDKYVLRKPTSGKTMYYFGTHCITDHPSLSKDEIALGFSFKDKNVAIYKGNFGPPHKGHFNLAFQGVKDLKPDILIIHAHNDQILSKSRHKVIDNHGSFVIWQCYAELLFQAFPTLTIMYSSESCHDDYRGIQLHNRMIWKVDCPAHFSTWHEKQSLFYIWGAEDTEKKSFFSQVSYDKIVEHYNQFKMPLKVTEPEIDLLRTSKERDTNNGRLPDTPIYFYPRQKDNLSATKFSQALKASDVIDVFLPDQLLTAEKNRVIKALHYIDNGLQKQLEMVEAWEYVQLVFPMYPGSEWRCIFIEEVSEHLLALVNTKKTDMCIIDGLLQIVFLNLFRFTSKKIHSAVSYLDKETNKRIVPPVDPKTWQSITALFTLLKTLSKDRHNFLTKWIETLPTISSQEEYDIFAAGCEAQMYENYENRKMRGFKTFADRDEEAILSKSNPYNNSYYKRFYLESYYL